MPGAQSRRTFEVESHMHSSLFEDLARKPTQAAMAQIIAAASGSKFAPEDIHGLASVLARSGTLFEPAGRSTADLASTGGPGSLSTLLCPLYLASWGFAVPKLGVPGRPAGGVDVLAQLDGFKTTLAMAEIHDVLDRCGYAHFLAGRDFAPLDAALFGYRQKVGAQDNPELAAASLLAKKIACGVRYAGLDVRVAPHGNFGKNFEQARQAAESFCAAARLGGIAAVAVLTDARWPYQPFIGRGEALLAMRLLFDGKAGAWLSEHNDRCRAIAGHVAALATGHSRPAEPRGIGAAFAGNVAAQGSSMDAFAQKTHTVERQHTGELTAPRDGFLGLDLAALRSAFTAANSAPEGEFPDRAGLILRCKPGRFVKKGDLLASIRADSAIRTEFMDRTKEAFQVADLLDYAAGLEGVVRA